MSYSHLLGVEKILRASDVENVTVEGAARETWEEANCQVEILAPYSHFDIPVIGQAYILFRCIYAANIRFNGSVMQHYHCCVRGLFGALVLKEGVLSRSFLHHVSP